MIERRSHLRRRVFKAGSILIDQRLADVGCIVRNISVGGACLEFERPPAVPNQFMLLIASEHLERPCQLAWRAERRVGVRFN